MTTQVPSTRFILRLLLVFFFFSGASSLIFETIFTRLLTYTFGNTAYAVSTVLAALLGGLALGAFLIGRWVDRRGASPPVVKREISGCQLERARRPGSLRDDSYAVHAQL